MAKEEWTSINAYIDIAIEYLHHGKLTMCFNNLLAAKEALNELDTMADS